MVEVRRMSRQLTRIRICLTMLMVMIILSACAGNKSSAESDALFRQSTGLPNESLNRKITTNALMDQQSSISSVYNLGVGDLLELSVFQVESLNKTFRVNGRGEVMLPLLGVIDLGGKSVEEAEQIIRDRLSEEYLQSPQVSLFVKEYRSQQITVMGAVTRPDIYNVTRSRSIVEMLSMAGGIAKNAADTIRVNTYQYDPEAGKRIPSNLVIDLNNLLSHQEVATSLRLSGGDSVYVPEAGVFYVEGAIENPGAYNMSGEVGVLQAISMAGGVPWAGNEGKIRVLRKVDGKMVSTNVDIRKVRKLSSPDINLRDGDIVVVGYRVGRRMVSGIVKGVSSIVNFGYGIN